MRWFLVLAALGACGGGKPPPASGGVSLVLDIPNGMLDPRGYTAVEVVLHKSSEDLVRAAAVASDGTFDLGAIDPSTSISVEATLRNVSGAAVGYGRTAMAQAFAGGAEVVVPVRRPIGYFAGTVSRPSGSLQNLHWTEAPATYSDLSVGTMLDGKTQVGGPVVMVIAAGPNLYGVTQATSDPSGTLVGPARLVPFSTVDHAVGAMLAGTMTGAVIDGAGADDGSTLVIGTSAQLFAIDTASGAARALADGNFARVAVMTSDTGEVNAIAIKNRGPTSGACSTSAELWWARLSGPPMPAQMVTTGGFSDVAADRGHVYYVDSCKGELGEVTTSGARMLRTINAGASARATMLAVSNGQAYIGVETAPATTALLVASLPTMEGQTPEDPRTLWNEAAQQVVRATDFRGVLRQLDATSATFGHLEIGAGGDYVTLTTSAHFHGDAVLAANFPELTIDTEELRVFDAATGGVVQRYRSWCAGVINATAGDIDRWSCALAAGQTAAATGFDHHIGSMTFMFGKR